MQPQSPNPNFDFMLKDSQTSKKRLPLPALNLPKPAKFILVAVAGLFILIVVIALLSGRGNGSFKNFDGVLARCQETLRVTAAVQQLNLQDPQTQALAATVSDTLTSDKTQMTKYLANNHFSVSASQLGADLNKSTDTTLQTAAENNGLDAAYVSYLKDALSHYQTDLQTAYQTAGPNGRVLLNHAFDSVKTLLSSPPLKS